MPTKLFTLTLLFVVAFAAAAMPTWAGPPAKGDQMLLGTRGFARTSSDHNNVNKEGETLFRMEFPYGASAGWKLTYQGYSDGTDDDLLLLGAGIWIQQTPSDKLVRLRLTFGGANTVTIAKDALVDTDAIAQPLKAGAVVWATQWYRAGLPTTGLPFQTFLYGRELAGPGSESQDGALAGPIGSLTDHTLVGGFDHSPVGPLNAGLGYVLRGYQPMCASGLPNPNYKGPRIAPIFIGDSINVMQDDVAPDDMINYTFRGFAGRFCKNNYPFLIFGQSGSGSGGFMAQVGKPLFTFVFGEPGKSNAKVSHLVNEYGVNEIRSSGSGMDTWNKRLAVANVCHTYGIPYIQTTLLPCGPGNLMGPAKDNGLPAFIAQRKIFNDLVRSQSDNNHIPGCIGFVDPCTAIETDWANSNNVWVAGNGGDLHPNSVGMQHYADCFSPKLFEIHK